MTPRNPCERCGIDLPGRATGECVDCQPQEIEQAIEERRRLYRATYYAKNREAVRARKRERYARRVAS